MGTSKAVRAPPTRKWNAVLGALDAPIRDTDFIANATLSIAIGCLSNTSPVNAPLIFGMAEGVRFLSDVNEYGINEATERGALRVVSNYLIPSLSDALWSEVLSNVDSEHVNSPFSRLAETAFKKTLNQIMIKGVEAYVEEF